MQSLVNVSVIMPGNVVRKLLQRKMANEWAHWSGPDNGIKGRFTWLF
jgi:hypothetical protein